MYIRKISFIVILLIGNCLSISSRLSAHFLANVLKKCAYFRYRHPRITKGIYCTLAGGALIGVYVKDKEVFKALAQLAGTLGAMYFFKRLDMKMQESTTDLHFENQAARTATTFASIAGALPEEIHAITDLIRNYDSHTKKFNLTLPKGILLYGEPGNGKTHIARAIAGEANAAFFSCSAAELVTVWQGSGPRNIQNLFKQAYNAVNSGAYNIAIIFIDEIDAIGASRTSSLTNTSEANTLRQLLTEMDGFIQHPNCFVIGATNKPEMLDRALTRTGRLDQHIHIPLPNTSSRKAIIQLYSNTLKSIDPINVSLLAHITEGLTCSDLKTLVNQAALLAAVHKSKCIRQQHFINALFKIKSSHLQKNKLMPELAYNLLPEKIGLLAAALASRHNLLCIDDNNGSIVANLC